MKFLQNPENICLKNNTDFHLEKFDENQTTNEGLCIIKNVDW